MGSQKHCIFDDLKFMILRYGKNQTMKDDILYSIPNMFATVEEFNDYRDLGVQLENDKSFRIHIS